jgi:Type II secretion system (T2SS), protein G
MSTSSKRIMTASFLTVLFLLTACDHDGSPNELQMGRTKARMEVTCSLLEGYREDYKMLPEKSKGLEAIIDSSKQPSRSSMLKDGWGHPLRPVISGNFIVGAYSVGLNGKDEKSGGDDISCLVKLGSG